MQKDVALKLTDYGFKVNAKTIYNWEKSVSQPNINQFLALCDILGVDDVLWQFAGIYKGRYAGLNTDGRKKALEFIELLLQIEHYKAPPMLVAEGSASVGADAGVDAGASANLNASATAGTGSGITDSNAGLSIPAPSSAATAIVSSASAAGPSSELTSAMPALLPVPPPTSGAPAVPANANASASAPTPRMLRLYDIPASAGTGNFLDDSGFEMIEAPGFVPDAVDFALRVSGDSMEPLFRDGQMIWIKKREAFGHGDIGIFIFSGDVYCKKLIIEEGRAFLRSVNPAYDDIEVIEDLGFKAIGVVVS